VPDAHARATYERTGIGGRLPPGRRPAVVVADLCLGFTDARCSLGADLDAEVKATARLLAAARRRGVPVVFTTIAYDDAELERLLWTRKMPGLAELGPGSRWTRLDPRLDRRPDEPVIVKQGASAFFGTQLASVLVSAGVDSVVLCGASTSGCVSDGGRPHAVRLAGGRAARVRRGPRAGRGGGEPIRHRRQVRRRGLTRRGPRYVEVHA
jgi:maleamate amidohydrolase